MNSPNDNKTVVLRYNKEYLQEGKESVFWDIFAPDFVDNNPESGIPPDRDGAFQFNKALRIAFPDLQADIRDQIAEGDKVVTRKIYRGTHQGPFEDIPASGNKVSFQVIEIVRFRNGQYIEHWATADLMSLMKQIRPASDQ